MTKKGWGSTTDRIMILLQDNELTKAEICQELGLDHDAVSSTLTRLKRRSKKFGKRIYICSYTREADGQKNHIRPIFTAGDRQNAHRPKAIPAKVRGLQYYHTRMAKLRNRSIFSLGKTKRELLSQHLTNESRGICGHTMGH